ncbi:sugar transferase [Mesobacterium pallidum]|uniref:sugar transferase n=1 Tax=Mesobacterium pallidum TaxID=2872037 RepID=UPI001EE1CE32|nr:sugar transferase [Mesobacterium pallidum]
MTPAKRLLDLASALVLTLVLIPVIAWVAAWILLRDGRPILYVSERMRALGQPFRLVKFRTMTTVATDAGVSGGDKAHRITHTGATLRRYRLDEIPQLWNVFRGDISFVGPRPPLRRYVDMFPDLYADVLKSRPGITGLATLVYHAREERLLARCRTPEETEAVYTRICVPAKARLDLIYQEKRNVCWDFRLMVATVFKRLGIH